MKTLLVALLTFSTATAARAAAAPDSIRHDALHLAVHDVGISFGNAPRVHGVRASWRDRGLERVDGLDLTVFGVDENPRAIVRGIGINLYGGAYDSHPGLEFGVTSASWVSEIDGLGLSLISLQVQRAHGLLIGGLAAVTGEGWSGLAVGGVFSGSGAGWGVRAGSVLVEGRGRVTGVTAGGVCVHTDGDLRGITAAAFIYGDRLSGINLGGVVMSRSASGLNAALAGVAGDRVRGITAGALVMADSQITGIAVAGLIAPGGLDMDMFREPLPNITGVMLAGVVAARDLSGLSVACYHRVRGVQRGVTIGLFNDAGSLSGVQLGLLNRVRNRQGLLRTLPIANARFGS